MRFQIRKKIYNFLTSKSIDVLYAFILIVMFYLIDTFVLKKSFNFKDYFELKLATSLSATYFIAVAIKRIAKSIEKKIEDGLKLTTEYDKIIKQYSNNSKRLVCHKAMEQAVYFNESGFLKGECIETEGNVYETYPIMMEYFHSPNNKFEIEDLKEKHYVLPTIIESNFMNIFGSHKNSKVFNGINIRLDDLCVKDNTIKLITSRTSYYNGLVTNRAMDHQIGASVSIRQLFEFDKNISLLRNSKMSNHIGVNGSILCTDNKIVFVKRFGNVSIGKNILGNSLGASLKIKYCINPDTGEFTLSGLEKGIRSELEDELGLKDEDYDFSLEKSIVGIYRDLIEGGKPQILLACRATIDSNTLKIKFAEKCINKENKNSLKVDGNKIVSINIDHILTNKTSIIDTANNKNYETIPTVSASTLMTIDWFKKNY